MCETERPSAVRNLILWFKGRNIDLNTQVMILGDSVGVLHRPLSLLCDIAVHGLKYAGLFWHLLLTWINFNPSMDK